MVPGIGQIVLCAFTFAQDTTLVCDGSLVGVNNALELFVLIGNQYGGDGKATFALPNLPVPAPLTAANATWQITYQGASFPPYSFNDQFLAELDLFAAGPDPGGSNPGAYVTPNGQVLPVSPNTPLFSLIGTTYGGNGTSFFALPTLAPPSGSNTAGTSLAYGVCYTGGIYPSPTRSGVNDSTIGTLQLFAFPWVPFNYLACNGQAVSVATYPALHSVVGNAFGGGGSTFNVPNLAAPTGMQWGIVANGVMPSNVNET